MTLRVVYLTLPGLLDVSLSFVQAMGRQAELHALLQMTAGSGRNGDAGWNASLFDLPVAPLPVGVSPAAPLLSGFPAALQGTWRQATDFHLAVFAGSSAVHPASWRTTRQVLDMVRRLRPDVIHFETTSGRMAWSLPWLRRIAPLVVTVHDPQPHSGEAPLKKRLIRWLTYAQTDRFILHNQAQVASFCGEQHVAPERVEVLPLGAYDLYRLWAAETPPVVEPLQVLFFGRLSPYKGLETLFAAAERAAQRVAGLRLVVAGRPIPGYRLPPAPHLAQGGRVELIERYLSNAELADLFQRSSLVVCPYHDATQSGVILTAYAFGRPVIATAVGGLPEYVEEGQTGCIVPARDAEALTAALVDTLTALASVPGERARYESAIRQLCQTRLAWETIATRTLAVYEHAGAAAH